VDAELLLSLAAKIARERRTQDVLDATVQGLAGLPGVALARVWLARPEDSCDESFVREECPDPAQCLYLAASAGSLQGGAEDWSTLQGHFQGIPLNHGKAAQIGATGETIHIKDAVAESESMAPPDWLRREGIRGFSGHALVSQETILGVLAIFTREELPDEDSERLRKFAEHVAAGITNTRAFEDLSRAEAGLRQIVNVVRHHLTIVEPGLGTVFANNAARNYFSIGRQIAPREFLQLVTHTEDFGRFMEGVQQAMACGEFFETEVRMRGADGEYRWFLYQLYPLRDEDGRVFRWCVVRTDIEEQKRTQERTRRENFALREEIDKLSMSEEIVGTSPALQATLARVAKVAGTDSTVLITGETGTGKELVARAIHKRSRRSQRAFVSVNCAAIPRDLIASELFGHEKGAFTGALQRRLGRFELAEGGTLFLDEVGELPAETQIALLRVLQEREFQRVGGGQTIRTDVRVITATHRDLPSAIASGTFRSDLFYRINVFPIHIPSLRERKEDIRLLVEYFVHRYSSRMGKQMNHIEKKSLDRLQMYPWPGNIRELQNVIERSVIVCESDTFSVDESWLSSNSRTGQPLPDVLTTQEKELIEAALTESKGRISGPSGAAARLGMPRSTLDSKIKTLKIDKHRFLSA
jgi:transcriptional regulator with GAF, ATPase, and Fis domain